MNKYKAALNQSLVVLSLVLTLVCVSYIPYARSKSHPEVASLTLFQAERQAQLHCPKDTVVWLNLRSGIYHFIGQRWYDNTVSGAYVCEKEADQAGDRATLNGQ
jgi:hypothetical protein